MSLSDFGRSGRFDSPGGLRSARTVPLASLEASDPDYTTEKGYFKGPAWPNLNFLAIRGLCEYGHRAEAERLARRWYNCCACLYEKTGGVYENMSSEQYDHPKERSFPDYVGHGCLTPVALPAMFGWGFRAWLYALAWLGLALGISHLTRSGSRATAIDLVAVALFTAWPMFLKVWAKGLEWPWLENFDAIVPSSVTLSLWRQSFTPLFTGGMHLLVLGLTYLMLGAAVFRRRDA